MNTLLLPLQWFGANILTKPAFFVGFLVFIGYLLLKKPFYEAFAGFIKGTVGYLLLGVGAGGLVRTFRPILAGLNERYHLSAAVIDPYFGLGATEKAFKAMGGDVATQALAWAMVALLVGFAVNIILVLFRKVTKIRTLFITGHIMQQQAQTAMWLILFLFPQFRNIYGALLVGVFSGVYWAVGSNLTVEATQRLTDGAGFAIGHQQMFAVWVTDKIAPYFGDPKNGIDDIKLPKWLTIFHDDIVSTGTLMLVFFGAIMYILGPEVLKYKGSSFFMYVVQTCLMFAVYLSVLRQGVRMFVAELTVSFQGISNTIIPGALPAVDCAATYGFGSPNAILFGFICGAIGQFIAILGLVVFHSPVLIVTGFVPVFFDNATIAIYANKRGGVKAAVLLTFISGILQVLLGAICVVLFGLIGAGGWHGNIDQSALWLIQGAVMKYLGIIGYVIVIVTMLIIPILQYRKAKDKDAYYRSEDYKEA